MKVVETEKRKTLTCPVCKTGELVAVSVGDGLVSVKLIYESRDKDNTPQTPNLQPKAIDVNPLVCKESTCSMIYLQGQHAPAEKKQKKRKLKKR